MQKLSKTKASDYSILSESRSTSQLTVRRNEVGAEGEAGLRYGPEPLDVGSVAVKQATPANFIEQGDKVRLLLRKTLGEDVFNSWFNTLKFDAFENGTVRVSVPMKFLRKWISTHYREQLLECCQAEFEGATAVDVAVRSVGKPNAAVAQQTEQPHSSLGRGGEGASHDRQLGRDAGTASGRDFGGALGADGANSAALMSPSPLQSRTQVAGFEGSPIDPRYTFENYVVGPTNRIAHAAAVRVAESVLTDNPGFNPLFLHAHVGLGKTHLLHAVAWAVRQRKPHANVLYLTAEGFRYRFVKALQSQDPLAFKEKFRQIDILLIDDLEFMTGDKTEQEFDHIINALLDGGRQVVVASARPPAHIERMNDRMRSRLQRGLVAEIGGLDRDLRLEVLKRRLDEKRQQDATFHLSDDVLNLLAAQLVENGRELEGAITRLYANWRYMRTPITIDIAETVIRDLVQGLEPRRIKIDDILRIISRHFGVSKSDLLSQRRHRSVVWPRQIGMYLAKKMTSRSLPDIGRRFGGRDHTTVLHAIRKIEGELTKNPGLNDEIDELMKLVSH
ncbi:MAG: chromosomal replication initiator protein DnaA [Pseudomonadota bacterium]